MPGRVLHSILASIIAAGNRTEGIVSGAANFTRFRSSPLRVKHAAIHCQVDADSRRIAYRNRALREAASVLSSSDLSRFFIRATGPPQVTPNYEECDMAKHFILEKKGRIATLTFNRPEKRNPLNEEIVLELEGLLQQVRDDKDARVMIFTGSGNTFSAGADLIADQGRHR
jgi:hypothetical protein